MKFRINYGKVLSQVNSLNEKARELELQVDNLMRLEDISKDVWKGEAAELFLQQLQNLRCELKRTNSEMYSLVRTIRDCAERIQREDEAAARRAALLKSRF